MTRSTDQLLQEIEAYIERNAMSATAFGEASINDRHLVRRLREGGSVTLDTSDRLRAFMAENRPVCKRRRGNESRAAA